MRKLLVFLTAISIISCSKELGEETVIVEEEIAYTFNESSKSDSDYLLSEYSQLVGNSLKDYEVKLFVDNNMDDLTEYGDKISVSYLLGDLNGIRKNESERFISKKKLKNNPFVVSIRKEISNSNKKYKYIFSKVTLSSENLSSKSSNEDMINLILENLVDENLEIYMPSKELENDVDDEVFYVSYAASYYTKTNEAFKYDSTSVNKGNSVDPVVVEIDDDFTEVNNVYLIKPIDECDILLDLEARKITSNSGCGGSGGGGGNPPDPIEGGAVLLKYNVNHTTIEDKDILSTRLGWFRVRGTSWVGFGGSHQKLALHRGSPDGKITVSGSQVIPEAKAYTFANLKVTRRTVRKENWRKVNIEFDDDWSMSENEQAIAVFTKHHLKAEAETELNVKTSYKVVDGELTPTTEPTVSTKVTTKESAAKFREKRALSRRQVLATIVGLGVTGKTLHDDGDDVDYNVKQAGRFEYVLKHYYTDID